MIAYYVSGRHYDTVVIPETQIFIQVDAGVLRRFLAEEPQFGTWQGEALEGLAPESFGRILAVRDESEPPEIKDQEAWNKRVFSLLRPG